MSGNVFKTDLHPCYPGLGLRPTRLELGLEPMVLDCAVSVQTQPAAAQLFTVTTEKWKSLSHAMGDFTFWLSLLL